MTSQKIAIGFVAVALFVGSMTAHAADFDTGIKAYERGDYATALRIFRQFADQGSAYAQAIIGLMYEEGQGVKQDYAAAVRWYRKAANQGWPKAQNDLGVMYSRGWGVTQDYVQALMWFNLAAAGGWVGSWKDAKNNRNRLRENMTLVQIAEAYKLAREWKPKGQ